MIGHRDARYTEFGWAAARLDDLFNLAPARITGLLIALAARSRAALEVMMRDARKHASPNAGFPEAAMAGALGIRLGGPRAYEGEVHELPWFGDGRIEANADDMQRAGRLYVTALLLHGAIILALWLWL
jgi:adenosylcobinamide-phosphate synthase